MRRDIASADRRHEEISERLEHKILSPPPERTRAPHGGAEVIAKYGAPQIMNTDHGSQFTGAEFIGELRAHGIAISMDGRGQWRDNVFIERLRKSVKYEDVYLNAYETVSDARAGISHCIDFYNSRRPHRAHGGRTPEVVYFAAPYETRQAA